MVVLIIIGHLFVSILVAIKKIKTWNKIDYLKNILGYALLIFLLWAHIGHLKYGFPLIKENYNHSLIVEGKIEDIKILKYGPRFIKADDSYLITILGKKYYIMSSKNLEIGDYVEISYLPKSTIVLEVNIIEVE